MESKFFVTKTNIEDDIRDRRDDRIEKVTYLLCRDICSPLTFDHDLPHIPILVAFITSVTHPTFSHFVGPYEILPQLPIFPLRSSFSLLIIWPNKVAWHLQILLIFITSYLFVPAFRFTFRLISLQFMRFVAISLEATFLLPPVSFVVAL